MVGNVKWYALKKLAGKLGKVGKEDKDKVAAALRQLMATGILDDAAQMNQERIKRKISGFPD